MKNYEAPNNFNPNFLRKIIRSICFIGGADLDVLDTIKTETKKHPNETNVFFVMGILVCMLALLSAITLYFLIVSTSLIKIFTVIIPIFFGIVIFVSYWSILSVGSKSSHFSFIVRLFVFIAIVLISIIVTAGIINRFFILTYDGIIGNIFTCLFIYLSVNLLYTLPVILKKIIIYHTKYTVDDIFNLKTEAENEVYKKLYPQHLGDVIADSLCTKHIKIITEEHLEFLKCELYLLEKTYESLREIEELIINNKDRIDASQLTEFKKNIKEQLSYTSKKIKDSINFNLKKE